MFFLEKKNRHEDCHPTKCDFFLFIHKKRHVRKDKRNIKKKPAVYQKPLMKDCKLAVKHFKHASDKKKKTPFI